MGESEFIYAPLPVFLELLHETNKRGMDTVLEGTVSGTQVKK
jgi:hypothetical protein